MGKIRKSKLPKQETKNVKQQMIPSNRKKLCILQKERKKEKNVRNEGGKKERKEKQRKKE